MKKSSLPEKNFYAAVWAGLLKENRAVFKRGDIVVTGVSGGADSVCLLHFLKLLSVKQRFTLYACHVNHNLRKNAERDEKFTVNLCEKQGVECFVERADVKKLIKENKLSVEHAARKARYAAFEKVCKKTKATFLALAHHLDDNAETVLINLLRGTKAKGLAGISPRRPLNKNTEVVRPFLSIGREDVENYAKFNKLKFVNDETNALDIYTRNWVRKVLLPLLEKKQPRIREHLNLIAADARRILNSYEN